MMSRLGLITGLGRNVRMPVHPAIETLALYSAADLPLLTRLRIKRHVARCGDCEQQVLLLRSAIGEMKREAGAQTLTGFEAIAHWPELERDMMGNIAVGLDAALCIENVGRKRTFFYRFAMAAGLAVLFAAGWMTHIPREETNRLLASLRGAAGGVIGGGLMGLDKPPPMGTVLRSTPGGIAVRTQGGTLTILHPTSAVISLSGRSGVSARYIDEDTGQVTIAKVYGQ
jgi:hypothetical protein